MKLDTSDKRMNAAKQIIEAQPDALEQHIRKEVRSSERFSNRI